MGFVTLDNMVKLPDVPTCTATPFTTFIFQENAHTEDV
jgi:hypothetical protein